MSEARLVVEGSLLVFEIEANAFCQQMVRSLVGMLVDVGRGRRPPVEVNLALRRGTREGLPAPAPAEGLCLVAVSYPSELGGTVS